MRQAVPVRLRQELAKLRVEINEEKSKTVDLDRGDSFGFLGFEFRRIRALRGVWRPNFAPKHKKRTALLAKLREVFRRYRSQPIRRVVDEINPIVRGLGELLLGGAFQRLLQLRQRLGGEEDSTSHAAGPETSRLRLAEVEYAMAVRNVGVVQHYRVRYYTPKASASG
jgi:RNA-directed DNA polymerase